MLIGTRSTDSSRRVAVTTTSSSEFTGAEVTSVSAWAVGGPDSAMTDAVRISTEKTLRMLFTFFSRFESRHLNSQRFYFFRHNPTRSRQGRGFLRGLRRADASANRLLDSPE